MQSVSEYLSRWVKRFGAADDGRPRARRRRRRKIAATSGWISRLTRIADHAAPWHATAAACLFLVSALVYAMALGGHLSVLSNAAWRVGNASADLVGLSIREVNISGLNRSRPEEVLDIIGVRRGVSMIGFDAVRARERLEATDWIASASILRQFPDRLSITVREREPFALWQYEGVFHVIDADGVALDTFAIGDYIDLPIVVGEGAQSEASQLLNHLEAWPEVRSRMRAAARVAERRWTLYLTNGMKVLMPEGDASNAFDRLARLHREQGLLDRDIEVVDLRLADRTILLLSQEVHDAREETLRAVSMSNRGAGI